MSVFRLLSILLFFLAAILPASAKPSVFNVRDFGAVGDGIHIDSPAIDHAIDAAAKERKGGVVVLPAGVYSCYSVHLKSNVTLRFEQGAVVKAAPVTKTEGYDEAEPNDSRYQDFGHSHWHNSLIWGENLRNVTLEGSGLIDGNGVLTRGGQRKNADDITTANKAIALRDCRDVTIRGLNFLSCGHFALLLTGVDHLLIEDVTADTNRDGFDIDCCEHVVVRRCRVNTVNDDAIVLKCSYALGWAKPTSHVLIEDCQVSGFDEETLLNGTRTTNTVKAPDGDGPTGRIKLGTESNGGFRHITIRRCTFTHCRGLALETVDGAPMEDITVTDIQMDDICNSPLYIRLGDRMRAPQGMPPSKVDGIRIQRMQVTDADARYACLIAGIEGHPVRNVVIKDIDIQFRGGITLDDVKQQRGSNPFFFGQGGAAAAINRHEKIGGYPEPSAHGIQPAWAFSISHDENIKLKNINVSTLKTDERPPIFQQDAKNIRFVNVKANSNDVTVGF